MVSWSHFLDARGLIHIDYLQMGKTIFEPYYAVLLTRICDYLKKIDQILKTRKSYTLSSRQDNAWVKGDLIHIIRNRKGTRNWKNLFNKCIELKGDLLKNKMFFLYFSGTFWTTLAEKKTMYIYPLSIHICNLKMCLLAQYLFCSSKLV